jgi:hypothetical protein
MAKIRKDLVGIALAVSAVGEPIILRAGDKVPDGVEVGDHLLAKKSNDDSGSQDGANGSDGASTPGSGGSAGESPTGSENGDSLPVPPLTGAGSGTDVWRAYAIAAAAKAGLQLEIADDAKRGDIVEALKSAGIATE